MNRLIKVLAILLLSPILLPAQQKITVDDFLQFHYPREIAVSPDGEQIAYIVRSADTEESEWRSHLWLFQPADGTDRQLTFGAAEDEHPAWSPDGRWLTFLSDRKPSTATDDADMGATQIWALPITGGEAQRWTASPASIDDYQWSPDGRHIIYLADQEQSDSVKARIEREQERKKDEVVKDSIRVNKVLDSFDVATQESRQIAVLDPGVREFDISPDGNWIVYETNYTGEYNDAQQYDLRTLHVSTGQTTRLTDFPGPETDPKFSPAGTRIAYIKQTTPDIEFAETDLAWCRFRPTRAAADTATLTLDYDRSVLSYVWLNRYELALQIADGTETPLVQITRMRLSNRFTQLTPDIGNVSNLSLPAGTQGP
ncbi:MAG TPA: hypothetical protein VKA68_16295, partial [bacterium]|nr:hypothetical protein [bacterium]